MPIRERSFGRCTFGFFFFFNDTATTEIYTLSLHDALPIPRDLNLDGSVDDLDHSADYRVGSEEHTSELQSHSELVCRLLLEKKKKHSCAHAGVGAQSCVDREGARRHEG